MESSSDTGRTDCDYKLIFEKDRLETFKGKWSTLKGYKHCTPTKFAAAGFYYVGTKDAPDTVKCFACRKELSDWEPEDDPWEEHSKRGKQCLFVKLKTKAGTTVKDFLELYYEMRKNIIIESFECKKLALDKLCNSLLKEIKEKKI